MRNIKKLTPDHLKKIIQEEKQKLRNEQNHKKSLNRLTRRQRKLLREFKNIIVLKKLLKRRIKKGL